VDILGKDIETPVIAIEKYNLNILALAVETSDIYIEVTQQFKYLCSIVNNDDDK
jgi:hypothetical protein